MVSKSFYSYVHTVERKRIVFVSLLDSPFENMNKMQGTPNEKSELITTDQLLDWKFAIYVFIEHVFPAWTLH